jgi:hypothetical protein
VDARKAYEILLIKRKYFYSDANVDGFLSTVHVQGPGAAQPAVRAGQGADTGGDPPRRD